MIDLTKGCPKCGGRKLTKHVSGITQEVYYDDGYIIKEVNKYEKSYEHCFVTCDHCKAEFKGPYLI
jgi:predicted  nucleic acid-binding Zn-ribbon protein